MLHKDTLINHMWLDKVNSCKFALWQMNTKNQS